MKPFSHYKERVLRFVHKKRIGIKSYSSKKVVTSSNNLLIEPSHHPLNEKIDADIKDAIKKSLIVRFKEDFNRLMKNASYKHNFNSLDKVFLKVYLVLAVWLFFCSFLFLKVFTTVVFLIFITFMTVVIPLLLYGLSFVMIKVVVRYIMFQRRKNIELYLPELLQLTAANMNAGMMLERALFGAVKPHFGVLRDEMELVAKDTLAGKSIDDALRTFVARYDSVVLERTVNIILEGVRSGSRMGDLLNKISINIQELRIMKKEMSASVTSYVIFITVASIIAAPVLMGLSHELLVVVKDIMSTVAIDSSSTSNMAFNLKFDSSVISILDFRIFTFANIFFTSLFSAMIVAVITKGSVKESLKTIPIFIIVASVMFILSFKFLNMMLGSFF